MDSESINIDRMTEEKDTIELLNEYEKRGFACLDMEILSAKPDAQSGKAKEFSYEDIREVTERIRMEFLNITIEDKQND